MAKRGTVTELASLDKEITKRTVKLKTVKQGYSFNSFAPAKQERNTKINTRVEVALTELGNILAEIAEQTIPSENDGGVSNEKHMWQKINNGKTIPLIEDISNV